MTPACEGMGVPVGIAPGMAACGLIGLGSFPSCPCGIPPVSRAARIFGNPVVGLGVWGMRIPFEVSWAKAEMRFA